MTPHLENAVADALLAVVHLDGSVGHDARARRILRGQYHPLPVTIPHRPLRRPARCNEVRRAIREGGA